jgi:hypothetical protein
LDMLEFVRNLTLGVVGLAWVVFMLSWAVGWVLKGLPLPFVRVKKTGARIIEDTVWAAFWLAMGTTVFAAISYVVSVVYQPMPPPPTV